MEEDQERPLPEQQQAIHEGATPAPLKPAVRQLHDDVEAPLLTPQAPSRASVKRSTSDIGSSDHPRHTHRLLIATTVVLTIAACQTRVMLVCPTFVGLLMASMGLIWLQMQPDMQLGSSPLTKVEIFMHCAAIVLSFLTVFVVIYMEIMCYGGGTGSSCESMDPYTQRMLKYTPYQPTLNPLAIFHSHHMQWSHLDRCTALLVAYTAHAIAALASLWNVVDAPAIAQHFRSQRTVDDVEGCAETESNDKAGSQTAEMSDLDAAKLTDTR